MASHRRHPHDHDGHAHQRHRTQAGEVPAAMYNPRFTLLPSRDGISAPPQVSPPHLHSSPTSVAPIAPVGNGPVFLTRRGRGARPSQPRDYVDPAGSLQAPASTGRGSRPVLHQEQVVPFGASDQASDRRVSHRARPPSPPLTVDPRADHVPPPGPPSPGPRLLVEYAGGRRPGFYYYDGALAGQSYGLSDDALSPVPAQPAYHYYASLLDSHSGGFGGDFILYDDRSEAGTATPPPPEHGAPRRGSRRANPPVRSVADRDSPGSEISSSSDEPSTRTPPQRRAPARHPDSARHSRPPDAPRRRQRQPVVEHHQRNSSDPRVRTSGIVEGQLPDSWPRQQRRSHQRHLDWEDESDREIMIERSSGPAMQRYRNSNQTHEMAAVNRRYVRRTGQAHVRRFDRRWEAIRGGASRAFPEE